MSKSGTSAAMPTGWEEASNVRIGPTPLRPSTQADQKASLPRPLGATTPNPVTTTLRMATLRPNTPGHSSPAHQTADRRPLQATHGSFLMLCREPPEPKGVCDGAGE